MKQKANQESDKASQILESDTYCPSIQKANSLHKQTKYDFLIFENLLKKQTLEKASTLITLLQEEVEILNQQLQQKELAFKNQSQLLKQNYHKRQEYLKQQIRELKQQIKAISKSKNVNKGSQIKPHSTIRFNNFALQSPHDLPNSANRSIQNFASSSNSMLINERTHRSMNSKMLNPISNISSVIFTAQLDKHQRKMRQIETLVQEQKLLTPTGISLQTEYQIKDFLSFKPFSIQKTCQIDIKQMVNQYELTIQGYKQYCAYLKAYLCECINFIGSNQRINQLHRSTKKDKRANYQNNQRNSIVLQSKNYDQSLKQAINLALRSTKEKLSRKIRVLVQQNKELRNILDQVVLQIKKSGNNSFQSYGKLQFP